MAQAARQYKVATQMGNQGHSGGGNRELCEMIWAGAIGSVRAVHCWTDRCRGRWTQGLMRPSGSDSVPASLNWESVDWPGADAPFPGTVAKGHYRRQARRGLSSQRVERLVGFRLRVDRGHGLPYHGRRLLVVETGGAGFGRCRPIHGSDGGHVPTGIDRSLSVSCARRVAALHADVVRPRVETTDAA